MSFPLALLNVKNLLNMYEVECFALLRQQASLGQY